MIAWLDKKTALEASLRDLKAKLEKCTDPAEREALRKQIEGVEGEIIALGSHKKNRPGDEEIKEIDDMIKKL